MLRFNSTDLYEYDDGNLAVISSQNTWSDDWRVAGPVFEMMRPSHRSDQQYNASDQHRNDVFPNE